MLKNRLIRLVPAIERALRDARSAAEKRAVLADLAQARESLAREVSDLRRLHDLSARLLGETALEAILQQVLEACTELLGAHKGNVQLFDPEARALRLAAHVGFRRNSWRLSGWCPWAGSVCAAWRWSSAAGSSSRTSFPTSARSGLAACTSTPLFDRNGNLSGMLSNHFGRARRPSERELQLLDLYVQQAARMIDLQAKA